MGNVRVYLTPDISAHSTTVRAGQLAELAPHRSGSLPLPAPNMLRLDESLPKSICTPACFTYAQALRTSNRTFARQDASRRTSLITLASGTRTRRLHGPNQAGPIWCF